MWMTPHTLAGIAIVTKIQNPVISLPLAFASHYLLDFIPHWTTRPSFHGKEGKVLFFDFSISLGLGLFFAFQYPFLSSEFLIIIAGAFLANLPDGLRVPQMLKHKKTEKLQDQHFLDSFHSKADQDVSVFNGTIFKFLEGKIWVGILTQIVIVLVCLFLIFQGLS